MSSKLQILLADDHPLFLAGVKNALQQFEILDVVAECNNGQQVLETLQQQVVDVAVLDLNMPFLNGAEVAAHIHLQHPGVKVVFLTMYQPPDFRLVRQKYPHALGYVLKNSGSEVLFEAITAAGRGVAYLDPRMKVTMPVREEDMPLTDIRLSKREKEIIRLIVLGKTNKEIADALFVSELTIKTHRKNIYHKMEVHNLGLLILKVQKLGILQ